MPRQRRNGSAPAPHDLDCERALLGLSLLTTEAAHTVARLPADAFYQPTNRAIADAVRQVVDDGYDPIPELIVARLTPERADQLTEQWDATTPLAALNKLAAAGASSVAASPHGLAERLRKLHRDRLALNSINDVRHAIWEGVPWTNIVEDLVQLSTTGTTQPAVAWVDLTTLGDVDEITPSVLHRDDGKDLLYPSAINALWGEPGCGKTWVAAMAALDVLSDDDGHVLYLDHEDTASRFRARLLALGATNAELGRVHYIDDLGPLTHDATAQIIDRAATTGARLAVIDGVAEALSAGGHDEDRATDYAQWLDTLPRPLARIGCAVLLLDHVTKNRDDRKQWARGTGHKLASISGVSYTVSAPHPIARDRSGEIRLTISKDRHGNIGARGETAAVIRFIPHDNGKRIQFEIRRPDHPILGLADAVAGDRGGELSPKFLEHVYRAIETCINRGDSGQGPTRTNIADELRAHKVAYRNDDLTPALLKLADAGRITRTARPGGGHHHLLVDPTGTTDSPAAAPDGGLFT